MRRTRHTRSHRMRHRRARVLVSLALCVLAAVIASPVPRPQPAAAQSVLPEPCETINLAITCDPLNPPPEVDESTLAVVEPVISPDPVGLVGLATNWLYVGVQDSVNDVPRPPSFDNEADFLAVQDSQPVGCYYAGPPQSVAGPMTASACVDGGGEVASYTQTIIPNGQEIDFGSPDELGATFQSVGWWPAVIEHTYEEKGVHTAEYRAYWRQWLWGCKLTPGSFVELFPAPPHFAWGWHCAGLGDLFVNVDADEVAFFTQNSFTYQVDESRATLK